MGQENNVCMPKGCCKCPGVDIEMKNAVAIQRNAAAIAATIKAMQGLLNQLTAVKERLTAAEQAIQELDPSGIEGLREEVEALQETVYNGPKCEFLSGDGSFFVPIAEDGDYSDDDSSE